MNSRKRRWAVIAAKGKTQYVVVRGILGFGIFTAVFALLWDYIRDHEVSQPRQFAIEFVIRLPFFLLGGYAFGLMTWSWFSRRYGRPVPPLQRHE